MTTITETAADSAIRRAIDNAEIAGVHLSKLDKIVIQMEVGLLLDHLPYPQDPDLVAYFATDYVPTLISDQLRMKQLTAYFLEHVVIDNRPEPDGLTGTATDPVIRALLRLNKSRASLESPLTEAIEEAIAS